MNRLSTGLSTLGKRTAAISGSLVALTSLLVNAPVWVATARGVVTMVAILVVVRLASGFLARSTPAVGSAPKL